MPRKTTGGKKAPRTKRKIWEKLGLSKSSYYRQRRASPARPPARSVLTRGDTERAAIAARFGESRVGEEPRVGEERVAQINDVTTQIAEAVKNALVSNALAQLEAILIGQDSDTAVLSMRGTVQSWAACALALRQAGY